MKKLLNFLLATMGLFLAMSMVSCSSDDDDDDNSFKDIDPSKIEEVIPPKILAQVKQYMPIYDGDTPPLVEGEYRLKPLCAVYCSDGPVSGFEPGEEVVSMMIKFINQNTATNQVDFYAKSAGTLNLSGPGAYIIGSGSNFTAFFLCTGSTAGVQTREVIVLSGQYSAKGISNCYYMTLMRDKGKDPNNEIMEKGTFRIFKDNDGLAECTYSPYI